MNNKAKDTIIRHLKGIVAALENKETPKVMTYRGKELNVCTDDEIQEALQARLDRSFMLLTDWQSMDITITQEAQKRGLSLKDEVDGKRCPHNRVMNDYCEPCGRTHST